MPRKYVGGKLCKLAACRLHACALFAGNKGHRTEAVAVAYYGNYYLGSERIFLTFSDGNDVAPLRKVGNVTLPVL